MNRAVSVVDKGAANMKRAASVAKGALAGIGAGLSVVGFTRFVKSGIDATDALGKMAQKTGIATKEFSKLAYAAKINDVEVEGFSKALLRLGTNADTAAGGNQKLAAAFKELNTETTDSAGRVRDADKIFLDVVDTFSKMEDGPRRNALALKVFGKSYAELIPLFNQGSAAIKAAGEEAERFGVAVTDEAAAAADEFNDNLDRLNAITKGVSITLGNDMIPAMNKIAVAMKEAYVESGLLKAGLVGIGGAMDELALGGEIGRNLRQIKTLREELRVLQKETSKGFVSSGIIDPLDGGLDLGRAKIDTTEAEARIKSAQDRLRAALKEGIALRPQPKPNDKEDKRNPPKGDEGAADRAAAAAASASEAAARAREAAIQSEADYILRLRETIATEVDASAAAKARFDILSGEASAFSGAGKARIIALAEEIDLLKESGEVQQELQKISHDREEQAITDAKALADKRIAIIESLRTPVEKYADAVRELSLVGLDQENLTRGIEAARKEMEGANQAAQGLKTTFADLGATFSSAFEDAIVNGAAFSDILSGIEKDLLRIGTRALITDPIANFFKSATESGGGGAGGAVSGILGKLFGGFKAEGGPVSSDQFYVVGEQGPEIFVPDSAGSIIKNSDTQKLLSSSNVTNNRATTNSVTHLAPKDQQARAAAAKAMEPQNFGGARADGGAVAAGKFYRVGERGPELLVAGGNGTIINHALTKQLFGGNRANGGPVEAGKFYRVGELGQELLLANNSTNTTNHSTSNRGPVTVNITYASPPRNAQERSSAMQVAAMAGNQIRKALERNT